MGQMILAVRKDVGGIPGGGFHYMLHPFAMADEREAQIFQMMGYNIIYVTISKGEELLKEAIAALNHQLDIAERVESSIERG